MNIMVIHVISHIVLTQVGMKSGIKLWGQQDVEAILKEAKQFYAHNIVGPFQPYEIIPEIKIVALGYLVFLKRNDIATLRYGAA